MTEQHDPSYRYWPDRPDQRCNWKSAPTDQPVSVESSPLSSVNYADLHRTDGCGQIARMTGSLIDRSPVPSVKEEAVDLEFADPVSFDARNLAIDRTSRFEAPLRLAKNGRLEDAEVEFLIARLKRLPDHAMPFNESITAAIVLTSPPLSNRRTGFVPASAHDIAKTPSLALRTKGWETRRIHCLQQGGVTAALTASQTAGK